MPVLDEAAVRATTSGILETSKSEPLLDRHVCTAERWKQVLGLHRGSNSSGALEIS
jgi:hypothetical protein